MKILNIGICFTIFFVLGACGSLFEVEPVGIGTDYSELKQSPCACLELKKVSELPGWLT